MALIDRNFTSNIAKQYKGAKIQTTLTEKLAERTKKAEDYFANMYDTAITKGYTAYEEASVRAKDLKRIGRMLRDRYDLTDAQILGLAQRPTGLYGEGLSGIEKAITKADDIGSPIQKNELLSLFETADQIELPTNMTFEDGIEKLAGVYVNRTKNDPDSKDEKNIYTNLLASALVINPKLNAQDMLKNTNVGGIPASDLYKQIGTLPDTNLFDVTFTDQVLDRRTLIEDNRLKTVEFKDFLTSFSDEAKFETSTEAFTANSSTQSIYANIPKAVFEIQQGMDMSQTEAVTYIKKQMELLKEGDSQRKGEQVNQIAERIKNLANGQIDALELSAETSKPKAIVEYSFSGQPTTATAGSGKIVFKITKADQNDKTYGQQIREFSLKLKDFMNNITLSKQKAQAEAHIYSTLSGSNLDDVTPEAKYKILEYIINTIYKNI